MKNFISVLTFFITLNVVIAQGNTFDWAISFQGESSAGLSVTTDSYGNVITVGQFSDSTDFNTTASNLILNSNGLKDIFIHKVNSNGDFLWVKKIGGSGYDSGEVVLTDNYNNIYISATFENTVDFDPSANVFNLTSSGGIDNVIIKLDENGNFIWAKQLQSSFSIRAEDISLDNSGNIYLTGNYSNTVDFDPNIGVYNLTANGGTDTFIQKLDENGNFIWAKSIGNSQYESGYAIENDLNDDVYISGVFRNTVDFNTGIPTNNLTSNGQSDNFILKLNSLGDFVWVKQIGGVGIENVASIKFDINGFIYLTGEFENSVDFDPNINSDVLTSFGSRDIFVLKLDINGNYIWSKQFGSPSQDFIRSIDTDSYGNAYITGIYSDNIDFDPGMNTFYLTTDSYQHIFIVKLNYNGDFGWAKEFEPSPIGTSRGYDVTLDYNDNVITTGSISRSNDLNTELGNFNITTPPGIAHPNGNTNCFVQKLAKCVAGDTTIDYQESCTDLLWIDGNIYSSNNNSAVYSLINTFGCDSVIKLNLIITALNSTIIANAGNLTSNVNNVSYQWFDCDLNSIIPNQNSISYSPILDGNYAVIISNEGKCSDTSDCIYFDFLNSNINFDFEQINIYPNPTINNINLVFSDNNSRTIYIYDVNGRIVYNAILLKKQNKISLHFLQSGIYFLRLEEEDYTKTFRILKY